MRGKGQGLIPTGRGQEDEDQGTILTSRSTEDSSRRTTLTVSLKPAQGDLRQTRGTQSSRELRLSTDSPWRCECQETVTQHHGLRGLGSQTNTLKCDIEPAILALAQEIWILRREDSISI